MTNKGWQRRFYEPIVLPDGRKLATLRDAGDYIAGLPAKTSAMPHWQTAIRELMISAERGGILMLAEIAMLQAIHHGKQPEKPERRKRARSAKIIS